MSDLPKLRFSGSLHIEVEMNLAEHFSKLSTAFHSDYWEMNLADWGYDEEYERPLAWVMSWLDQDMENASIGEATPGGTNRAHEIEWDGAHTVGHNPWSESHFNQLISLVPWMVPASKDEEDEERREDLSRLPGPNDRPLFGKYIRLPSGGFKWDDVPTTEAERAERLEATNPHLHPITGEE